jgi:hypothetical protein
MFIYISYVTLCWALGFYFVSWYVCNFIGKICDTKNNGRFVTLKIKEILGNYLI